MKRYGLLFIACFFFFTASAQLQDTSIFRYPIQMDSVVVRAARGGWDVQGFIRRIQTDTTFYKAFRTLHLIPFTASNDIRIFDKNGSIKASLKSHTTQARSGSCRTMHATDEQVTGDFFTRNGKYRYYTAELYAYLFLEKGPVCNETDMVAGDPDARGSGGLERSKHQLKQLIFNPGAKVSGVPFMGDKASIFDKDVAAMYDFKLESTEYLGEDCYLFRALPKKQYAGNVVYNELSTWFRKSDYSIVARDYSLSFRTMLYDFDVQMKVRLIRAGARLVPGRIEYDGEWRAATKGRERGRFVLKVMPRHNGRSG
jgi:hypothetical protein